MIKTRLFIVAAIAFFAAITHASYAKEHRACDNTRNYSACQLSLMAWDDETRAHNAGNGIYP